MASRRFSVAACQILVGADKAANLATAASAVRAAAVGGANMVVLPECFNSPYDTTQFPVHAETIPEKAEDASEADSPSSFLISQLARELGIYLVGGSIPERDGESVYNTSVVAGPDGQFLAKHRKVHLFDIDIPGKITFRESDTLSPGNSLTVFDTPWCKVGLGICYDMRFAELAGAMRRRGAAVLVFPGAFNTTTGPAHWELLQRARAVDCQAFVVTCSPARNPGGGYQAWGHSTIVSPWGDVAATTGHDPATVAAELDLDRVAEIRSSIPTSAQRRPDVYDQAA